MMTLNVLIVGLVLTFLASLVLTPVSFGSGCNLAVYGGRDIQEHFEELILTLPEPKGYEGDKEPNTVYCYGKNVLLNKWVSREGEEKISVFVCAGDDEVYPSCRIVRENGSFLCSFATTPPRLHSRIYFDYKLGDKFDEFYVQNMKPLGIPVGVTRKVQSLEPGVAVNCYDALSGRPIRYDEVSRKLDFVAYYGNVRSLREPVQTRSTFQVIKEAITGEE